jgi:hypothetical protein
MLDNSFKPSQYYQLCFHTHSTLEETYVKVARGFVYINVG